MKKSIVLMGMIAVLAVCAVGCSAGNRSAKNYPEREVELIVPYTAGGSVDITARSLAPSFGEALGQSVTVVNKPGAGGVVGFSYVAGAAPDGYTAGIVGFASLCINHELGELKADPVEDYDWIGGVCSDPTAICVAADSPFNSFRELIAYAKEHPEELSAAATGMRSMDAILMKDIELVTGAKFNGVYFDGASDCLTALLGGHVDLMSGNYAEMQQYVQAGQVKILVVGVEGYGYPTFEEEGCPCTFTQQIRGVFVPKGVDENVRAVMEKALETAVKSDSFKEELGKADIAPSYYTAEQMTENCRQALETLRKLKD